MKILIRFFPLVGLFFISINCTQPSSKTISIVAFEILNYSDTMILSDKTLFNKGENYLIKNYSESIKTENYIDSFVKRNRDASLTKYDNYSIIFYKESKKTNIENITKRPRDLDRYSQDQDLLFIYRWTNGKYEAKYKFKNGQIVNNGDIIIKDITEISRTIKKEKTDIELLKELAFCQCLEHSLETFSTLDTLEMGRGEVLNLMDSRGLFPNIVQPIFDSLCFKIVAAQIKAKNDTLYTHESARGRTSYTLACLDFYNSKKLDSLVKSIPKRDYKI